jgi:hypothetical protein
MVRNVTNAFAQAATNDFLFAKYEEWQVPAALFCVVTKDAQTGDYSHNRREMRKIEAAWAIEFYEHDLASPGTLDTLKNRVMQYVSMM